MKKILITKIYNTINQRDTTFALDPSIGRGRKTGINEKVCACALGIDSKYSIVDSMTALLASS